MLNWRSCFTFRASFCPSTTRNRTPLEISQERFGSLLPISVSFQMQLSLVYITVIVTRALVSHCRMARSMGPKFTSQRPKRFVLLKFSQESQLPGFRHGSSLLAAQSLNSSFHVDLSHVFRVQGRMPCTPVVTASTRREEQNRLVEHSSI